MDLMETHGMNSHHSCAINQIYYVRREHLRLVQDLEYLPTSIHVPPEKKHIKVSLRDQTLSAFENDKLVFNTKISSGLGHNEVTLR